MSESLSLTLRTRRAIRDLETRVSWEVVETAASWSPEHTGLVLCDVWDRHPCVGAELRLETMLPRMQRVVKALRDRGALVVHAPSETMAFYDGAPARLRALDAPSVPLPLAMDHEDPPLPVDSSDGGCDTTPYTPRKAWSRQHKAIEIDQELDVISDSGAELYSVYQNRRIETVLIMGVHTNMCVLNRTFAIKAMVRSGVRIALIRDLTDAMYNPLKPPYVSHDDGTRLVVEYIEKFWCPTIASDQVLAE